MIHSDSTPDDESATSLLYLYLWPFWMFKDVNHGSMLEQAAAYRHNREKRIYLPGYMLKWVLISLLLQGGIILFEWLGSAGLLWLGLSAMLAGATGICFSIALVVIMQIVVAYLFLCRWNQ